MCLITGTDWVTGLILIGQMGPGFDLEIIEDIELELCGYGVGFAFGYWFRHLIRMPPSCL